MRFLRADNPDIAMRLIPWFIPTNQNILQMGWELHERLREKPEDTFCLIALSKNIVQAVLIAYKEKRHVWLWQAHARNSFRYSESMFKGLIYWTKYKRMSRIKARVSDDKNREYYQKRYGFKCKRNKEIYLNV